MIIFNRLQPFKIQQSSLNLMFDLSSADFITLLSYIVQKTNEGLMADHQKLCNQMMESKLSNLVAKVFRTYQRELKRSQLKKPGDNLQLENLRSKHLTMQKAANDLFSDQVKQQFNLSKAQSMRDASLER